MPPGALGGGKRLGNDRHGALAAPRADAAWPDTEIVVAGHGIKRREVRQTLIFAGFVRLPHIARFSRTSRSGVLKP